MATRFCSRAGSMMVMACAVTLFAGAARASDGVCDPVPLGAWSSLAGGISAAFRLVSGREAKAERQPLLDVTLENGARGTVYGRWNGELTAPGFNDVMVRADGKNFSISSYGAAAIAEALCAPYKDDFPYTYETAEGTRWGERVLGFGSDLVGVPSDSGARVDSVFCMKEPY